MYWTDHQWGKIELSWCIYLTLTTNLSYECSFHYLNPLGVGVPSAGVPTLSGGPYPRESPLVITGVPLLKMGTALLWGLQPEACLHTDPWPFEGKWWSTFRVLIFLSYVAKNQLPGNKRMIDSPLPESWMLNHEAMNPALESMIK